MISILPDFMKKMAQRSWLIVLCIAAPIFLSTLFKGTPGKIITSDGNAYYAWLTTITADGDLDFRNDFMALYAPDPTSWISEIQGQVRNVTPPGMAVVMSPGFILAHVLAKAGGILGISSSTPYEPFYKNLTAGWLLALFMLGIWAFERTLESLTGSKTFASCSAICVALATNLIHYMAKEPSMGHATVFSITAITSHLIYTNRNKSFSIAPWLASGALVGLLLCVRNSSVVLLPWWLALGWTCSEARMQQKLKSGLSAGFAAALTFSIQPLMLSLMSGKFTLNGYPTYGFSSGAEGIWRGLFSARHGLFAYHPMWILILCALMIALKNSSLRLWALAAAAAFGMAVIINGTWPFWWFGDSFGNRAYVDVLAPCAIVAAAALHSKWDGILTTRVWWVTAGIATALIGANLVLWLGYLLRRYPSDGLHTYSEAWLWWLR